MIAVFLDTSAFLKLHVDEKGSDWIRTFVSNKTVVISELTFYESITALRRRYLNGVISRKQPSSIYAKIYNSRTTYDLVHIGDDKQLEKVAAVSFNLPANLRIRALDAIQLTSASIAKQRLIASDPDTSFVFVSSDVQLLRVAQAQSFATENPEDHP